MKALYEEDPQADIRFWGGDLMQKAGGFTSYYVVFHMNFLESVLQSLNTINFLQSKDKI